MISEHQNIGTTIHTQITKTTNGCISRVQMLCRKGDTERMIDEDKKNS